MKRKKDTLEKNCTNVKDLLLDGESILLETKPKKSAYVLSSVIKMMPIALIWIAVDVGLVIGVTKITETFPWYLYIFFAFHLLPVWLWVASIVKAVWEIDNIEYVATNMRIIVKTGIFTDIANLSYADVNTVNVRVGIIDKMLGVGDVYITAKNNYAILKDVQTPYVIVNKLQQIVQTHKSDVYFPNALRPDTTAAPSESAPQEEQ